MVSETDALSFDDLVARVEEQDHPHKAPPPPPPVDPEMAEWSTDHLLGLDEPVPDDMFDDLIKPKKVHHKEVKKVHHTKPKKHASKKHAAMVQVPKKTKKLKPSKKPSRAHKKIVHAKKHAHTAKKVMNLVAHRHGLGLPHGHHMVAKSTLKKHTKAHKVQKKKRSARRMKKKKEDDLLSSFGVHLPEGDDDDDEDEYSDDIVPENEEEDLDQVSIPHAHHKAKKRSGPMTLSGMAASMMKQNEDKLKAQKAAAQKKVTQAKKKKAENKRLREVTKKMQPNAVQLDLSGDDEEADDDDDVDNATHEQDLASFMDSGGSDW